MKVLSVEPQSLTAEPQTNPNPNLSASKVALLAEAVVVAGALHLPHARGAPAAATVHVRLAPILDTIEAARRHALPTHAGPALAVIPNNALLQIRALRVARAAAIHVRLRAAFDAVAAARRRALAATADAALAVGGGQAAEEVGALQGA